MMRATWIVAVGAVGLLGCGRGPAGRPNPSAGHVDGAAVFARECAGCHGAAGRADGTVSLSFDSPPRDFTTGIFGYTSTGAGQLPTDADLARTVREGLRWSAMPPFGVTLSPAEIDAVVAHVKTLSVRVDADGERFAYFAERSTPRVRTLPARPPVTQALIDRGLGLYLGTAECWSCHGEGGAGDGPRAGGLADEEGVPIEPRDLSYPVYQRSSDADEIFLRIRNGVPGTPMPAHGTSLLSDEDVWAIVYFIRSILREPVDAVERGRLIYNAHGCRDCHGDAEFSGAPTPGAAYDFVPPLDDVAKRLRVRSASEADVVQRWLVADPETRGALPKPRPVVRVAVDGFRRIILEGRAARRAPENSGPLGIARMPGYRGVLSAQQADQVIAYLLSMHLWFDADAGD